MLNAFVLRAKWTRAKRKGPLTNGTKPQLLPRPDDIRVGELQYIASQYHLGQAWAGGQLLELDWFVKSMRGELPPERQPTKNYSIHHVALPSVQYFLALEALTTRYGVKPEDATPRS